MKPGGGRVASSARGLAETAGDPGRPAGPARFSCPEGFCARRFAFRPGGPSGKRLLLIRAPADFRPESLSGRRLALLGSRPLRAPQPDGSQKVYGLLHGTRPESAARLLIAAGRPEHLTCAQPFGGSLRIQERVGGAPAAAAAGPPLFPLAERPPPRVPAGLRQRFSPFGARLGGPPRKAARGRRRPLLPRRQPPWQPDGPEPPRGGSPEPGLARAGSELRPLKEEAAEAGQAAGPSGPFEAASSSGEPGRRRRAGKKEKRRRIGLEAKEELPGVSSRYWQPEREPWWQAGSEPKGARTTEAPEAEECWGAAAIKEEPADVPCLGSPPEGDPRAPGEEPAGEAPCFKKKKKKGRRSREGGAEGLWGILPIKEEPGDAPCPGSPPEEGRGSARAELGRELTGYIKQSPGKGPWGIAALKEEPGDASHLGSLAGESWGFTPEDPAGAAPGCKKKRRRSRERAAEGLWGVFAIKEEPGGSCLGSLPEKSLGATPEDPAGELLTCKKKKKGGKLDKKPLQERGTETRCLEPNVLGWAAPLWQEAGPGEPWPTNGAAPRPKKKKGRRREQEDQAGLFAAGT